MRHEEELRAGAWPEKDEAKVLDIGTETLSRQDLLSGSTVEGSKRASFEREAVSLDLVVRTDEDQ